MSTNTITRDVPDVLAAVVHYGMAGEIQVNVLAQYPCDDFPALYAFTGSAFGGPITVTHESGLSYQVSAAARDRVDPGGTFDADPESWVRRFLA